MIASKLWKISGERNPSSFGLLDKCLVGTEAGAPIDLHLVKICKILCSSSWGLLGEGGWGKSQAMEGAVGLGAMCPWGVAGEGCLQV